MEERTNYGQFASRSESEPVSPSEVGSDFDITKIQMPVAFTNTMVLPNDPNRVSIMFPSPASGGSYRWQFGSEVASASMNVNSQSGNSFVLTYRQIGPIITFPLYIWNETESADGLFWVIRYIPKR